MSDHDPNAAAMGDGVYGLRCTPEEARVVLVPVPFEATTSYRPGTAAGPRAILAASRQVDLFDVETGSPWAEGIAMLPDPGTVRAWNEEARPQAERVMQAHGLDDEASSLDRSRLRVNTLCARVNSHVRQVVDGALDAGKVVGTIGGDHAVAFAAIEAHAKRHPGMGILQVDAHADLRHAYDGFEWSHASVMENVCRRIPEVSRLVQVGVRDLCEEEHECIRGSNGRIVTWFEPLLARERFEGTTWAQQVERILDDLPRDVYVSFDVDGLDSALCPHTGTPVPGGLSFQQASYLLGRIARSGRRIVGFDLVEVAPGPDGDEWDGNVGARLLYKLIGWSLCSLRGDPPVG